MVERWLLLLQPRLQVLKLRQGLQALRLGLLGCYEKLPKWYYCLTVMDPSTTRRGARGRQLKKQQHLELQQGQLRVLGQWPLEVWKSLPRYPLN